MAMTCPKCNDTFENRLQCPKCGVLLVVQAGQPGFSQSDAHRWGYKPAPRTEESSPPGSGSKWHQAPFGRICAGLLLALGLSYGLLQLCAILLDFLVKRSESETLSGGILLGLFYGLQGMAVLAGGTLAGAGRRQGTGYGAMVGLVSGSVALAILLSGVLSGMMDAFASELLTTGTPKQEIKIQGVAVHLVALYGLPVAHLIFGALGGLAGHLIWRPAPTLSMPVLLSSGEAVPAVGLQTNLLAPAKSAEEKASMLSGSIRWGRVLIGVAVAIFGGSAATKPVQQFVLKVSEGGLQIKDHLQDQVTLAEIFALSIFLGGTVAGATTPNGLKQGIVVGFLAGIGMVPFLVTKGEQSTYLISVVASAVFLAPLGGWFGSALLPPKPPPRLRDH